MQTIISDPVPPSLAAITNETKTEGPRAVTKFASALSNYWIKSIFDYFTLYCKLLETDPFA